MPVFADAEVMCTVLEEMQPCLSSHREEQRHRVELGDRSLAGRRGGAPCPGSAVLAAAHEDDNSLLSRILQQQLRTNTLHFIQGLPDVTPPLFLLYATATTSL